VTPPKAAQLAVAAALAALAAPVTADPAPIEAAIVIAPEAELPAIAARLEGHRFTRGDGVIVVEDVAGEGHPWVGVVERRGDALVLVTALGAFELTGPLARPRIAGPGYTVWVTGARDGARLAARRLGVLRRPPSRTP
jgi:hypothetical protein